MKRKMEVEDFVRIKSIASPSIAPRGNKVAYVVSRVDKEKDKSQSNLYLYDYNLGKTKQLTFSGEDSAPSFSPDGKKIAFISSRTEKSQIWILSLEGGEAWCLKTKEAVSPPLHWTPHCNEIVYCSEVFSHEKDQWTPYQGAPENDGKRLKELADNVHKEKNKEDEKDKKENKVKVITRFSYRFDRHGYYGDRRNHVFITPVMEEPELDRKPQGKQLSKKDYDYTDPILSPDGKYVVCSSRHSERADLEDKSDLWLIEVDTGKEHLLYDAPGPTSSPNWSPCGKYLCFSGHDQRVGASTSTDLWLLNVSLFLSQIQNNQETTPLLPSDASNITRRFDRPIAGSGGWQKDKFIFLVADKGANNVYEVDPLSLFAQPVLKIENRSLSTLAVDDDLLVYTFTTPTKSQELYLWDGEEKQITNINNDFLKETLICDSEKIIYESNDGKAIDGWVVYPQKFDKTKQYPLILLIHGGPHAAYGPTFMFDAQLFANEGYIVLYTNPRGSETYGQDFASCIDKKWGDLDYKDVMAGVDTLVEKGFIDTSKMFVHGWSYGGYMSCWISTQTDRFKAICAGASVTNLLSGYGTSDITLADEYEYGGTPWKDSSHLINHSPLGHVDKVNTPMMLMHGENDLRVAIAQTEEFFVALKRIEKEAIMIRYPDEFHGLSRPSHQLDRFERLVSWFNYHRDC
ncbi:S9 family peptidase [Salipaludibacillus daqingensis]|uniref:S9 family peptidase n=1 Tax=Salipaludibacillus daqingensis TaxID=3041001 RepID=UPI0024760C13|nr:S9 family peptidase [Salipaludibacillus daqingensis]